MPQLKPEDPMPAFALSLLVAAVQCQRSVKYIESELSSHFLNASTEGGTTPTKFSFPLYGRATCGNRRQIICGFNPVDITRAKTCLGGLGIGIICEEKGRSHGDFHPFGAFCQSPPEPLKQVKLLWLLHCNFHYRSCPVIS